MRAINFRRSFSRAPKPQVLVALGIVATQIAFAGPPYPPENRLTDRHLAADDVSIVAYLSHGFPDSAVWYHDSSVAVDTDIWHTYESLFDLVAQRKLLAAAPPLRLALSDPLPSHLEQAIRKEIAGRNPRSVSTATYDAEIANMRSWIAMTLARLDDKDSVDEIRALLQKMGPVARPMLGRPADSPMRKYTWAYTRLCEALAALGDKESVQILVDCLPNMSGDYAVVVSPLAHITGQGFGPHWGMPHRFHAQELRNWSDWWAINSATFVPNTDRILNPYASAKELPSNATIRDYVSAARDRIEAPTDTYILPSETTATLWLAAHAGEHTKELRKIADDPDELIDVRSKALLWYAAGVGKRALPTLERYAFEKVPFDPADVDLKAYLAWSARNVVLDQFPNSTLAKRLRARDEKLHRAAAAAAAATN